MMSYASSSSKTQSQGYDMFISFRGEDTRMGFISHLYNALTQKHIKTYIDDKSLQIGDFIAPELLEAIETSKFAIVVLSSNFATSKWCLEELSKIVDCMEQGKLIVIPVFYHVSPSDVRRQSNCFEQGFSNHEIDPVITPQKVATWRNAFAKVGAIKGLHVTLRRNESEVVCEIIRIFLKRKQDTLPVDVNDDLVGIESRVYEVKRMLSMDSCDVQIIGICGMSGVGKTTLAEVVFERIQNKFQESSFIENIKDISKENDSIRLCKLQQKLLDDILKEESIRVQSVKHGQSLIGTKLRCLKVIIVLDDVNHVDQFTYLAGGREWFGPGTRIIVTTTDIDLLNRHKIHEIYRCEELKGDDALSLFCKSAFEEGYPTPGFEKLSDDIVELAGGLPLALRVYGSILCGKEEDYWKDVLKKLQEYPHKEVLGRLEVVFARLDRYQQNAFIYIACFLKGRNEDLVKDILTNVGLYPRYGLPDLVNKFLITINHDDSVWMHDLLQKMCWEVLHKRSLGYNGEHIAIKYRQDVVEILSSRPKGMRTIDIINQENYKVETDDSFDDPTCFSKMTKLKFLRISNIYLPQGLSYLSNDLRILEWHGCSLKSLPSMFEPKHIYELEMCRSQLEILWERELDLPNLRSINLSFSKNLTNIPDLTSTPNLVKLNLEGCTNLTELHKSVLLHKKIRYMNLKGCMHLQNLGRSTMEMEDLEALLLSGCSNLEYIPEFGQNMKRLEHLYVDGTSIKKFPDNLGQMCDLRKLDASGTSIEELPTSIHCLKRLRLMCVHGCRLSSQTGGFLRSNLDTISSGLRELDLSNCNLSMVPDGIGSLYHLINLDLSGNDFVSLPASVALLSNLRMFCLNNCKRLRSLPKLSIVNEDTLYGLQSRFCYYISGKAVDVSGFRPTRNNSCPTISCLNCPQLAENERGSYLAEKILKSYLQLRTRYWITGEAVFEIIGAGRVIPPRFKIIGSGEHLILKGPWIGVAICVAISVHRIDAHMEANYVLTVHIDVGEKHWNIPVPMNFLVAGLDKQLVIYWTLADDLQRLVDSRQRNDFAFSYSMETRDGKLQVTNFGVQFIRDEDILKMKQHDDSMKKALKDLFQTTLLLPMNQRLQWSHANAILHTHYSIIDDLIRNIRLFMYQSKELIVVRDIISCFVAVNHEALSELKEERSHTKQMFTLVYDYYRISRGFSELYIEFITLLKDISTSWLSVKLALEVILVKCRADDCTYEEMLHQLNDLEVAKSVRFSDSFVTSFACICKQTVAFSRHFDEEIHGNKNLNSVTIFAKLSSIAIAGIFSIIATYMGDHELEKEIKHMTSYSMWLNVIQKLSWKNDKWFNSRRQQMKLSYDTELPILDFHNNATILQELTNKMAGSSNFTKEKEIEMMIVIAKLQKNIDKFSVIIEDMSGLAHKYWIDIKEAGVTLNPFISHSNLQVTKSGVHFMHDEYTQLLTRNQDSATKALRIVYRATLSIPADLPWYICASEVYKNHHSYHLIIHEHTSYVMKFIIGYRKQRDSLQGICKIFECLHEINQEALKVLSVFKEEWVSGKAYSLVNDYRQIRNQTFKLYQDFVSLLKEISDHWSSVKLALETIVEERKYPYGVILEQNDNFKVSTSVVISYDRFVKSFNSISEQTIVFLRNFSQMIQGNEHMKSVKVVAEVSRVTIAGVFSVMAMYVGDSRLLQELKDITCNTMLLHLIEEFSRKGGEWFDVSGELMKRSYGDELQIWNFYGDAILHEIKMGMQTVGYGYYTVGNEEDIVSIIDKLERTMDKFSKRIEDMHSQLPMRTKINDGQK